MAEVAILVPMWGRPHRVAPLLASIEESTRLARTVFVVSPEDVDVRRAVIAAIREMPEGPVDLIDADWPGGTPGDYARKINVAAAQTNEPLLFTAADDLQFHQGWFELCCRHLQTPGIGVVGTNDLGNRRTFAGRHSTHSLVTRAYVEEYGTIDEPGKVLHEGYWHEFVDDEFVRTAMHRGAFAHERRAHVEHLHPNWGKAASDASYEMQEQRMAQGRALFLARQHLWGGTVQ